MPTANLRFGAFDEKKKREIEDEERAVTNPWPNPTPEVAPGSRKVSEIIFSGLGGVQPSESSPVSDTISGVIDESPVTEMDALKSRFGLGSQAIDVGRDKTAVGNMLASPTDVSSGMMSYAPEKNTGGDYLAIMARNGQNRAVGNYNQAVVGQQQSEDMRREEAVKNALAQEANWNAMEAKRQEAERLQAFFDATGLPPSPQASAAFSLERGRQTAAAQFTEAIKGLIVQKEADYKKLLAGYENVPEAELPPAIRTQMSRIDQKYQDIENKMVLAAGLQSGTNNPGNMVSKDQVQQLVP